MAGVDLPGAHLSADDRQRLDAWLTGFEREWEDTLLAVRFAQLPPGDDPLRLPLLAGMVRIDLRRRWQRGQPVGVERYLEDYPELGTPDSVATELILEEYEARRQYGVPAERAEFARRFPGRAEQLWHDLDETRALATAAEPGTLTRAMAPSSDPLTTPARKIPAALPEQFGRYRIIQQLGRGGMGTVYLAHDTQLDRRVALKVPHFIADDPTARERFYREARVAATLDHRNLCPVYDVGELEGILYLTMPYLEGRPLSEWIAGGPMGSQRQIATLIRQLALALQEAHRRGILHRDLKPSNIMMSQPAEPVVMDFGLARKADAVDVRLTQTGTIVGTPAYMPPEQVDGATTLLGPTCDIYSLGVILYELLTGRLPFQGSTTQVLCQILRDEPRRPSAYRPDLAPRLEAICKKAMAKRISERYRSMADLAADLEQFLQAPEAPDAPTVELVSPANEETVPIVRARKGSDRDTPEPARTEPLLEVLPAGPPRAAPRRRRRWPAVLLGCLTLVLFFCGGPILLLTILVPRAGEKIKEGFGWVEGEVARQSDWNSLALRWKAPPPNADPQELFPNRLGEFERGDIGEGVPLAEYDLETTGRRAIYRSPVGEVELYALRATSLEREDIFKRVLDGLEKRPNMRRTVLGGTDSHRLIFSLGSAEKGMLWWNQGWLFIAYSRDGVNVEAVLRTYLDRISREAKK